MSGVGCDFLQNLFVLGLEPTLWQNVKMILHGLTCRNSQTTFKHSKTICLHKILFLCTRYKLASLASLCGVSLLAPGVTWRDSCDGNSKVLPCTANAWVMPDSSWFLMMLMAGAWNHLRIPNPAIVANVRSATKMADTPMAPTRKLIQRNATENCFRNSLGFAFHQ